MKHTSLLTYLITICIYVISLPAMAQEKNSTITIQTSGHCGECKKSIEKALTFEKGVKDVSFETSTGKVEIVYNPKKTNPDALRKAISMIGYDADSVAADPVNYEKLKACCKKEGKDLMKH